MSTFVASDQGMVKNIEIIRQCGRDDKVNGLGELNGWLTIESTIQQQLGNGSLLGRVFRKAYTEGWTEAIAP